MVTGNDRTGGKLRNTTKLINGSKATDVVNEVQVWFTSWQRSPSFC